MHKHDFVGAQSIYTRVILANKEYICMIFLWGAPGGGAHAPQAPPPPVAMPLCKTAWFFTQTCFFFVNDTHNSHSVSDVYKGFFNFRNITFLPSKQNKPVSIDIKCKKVLSIMTKKISYAFLSTLNTPLIKIVLRHCCKTNIRQNDSIQPCAHSPH